MSLSRLWPLLLCLCALLPGVAAAQNRGCSVVAAPAFNFGDVTSNPTEDIDVDSSLTVRCTGNGSEHNLVLKVCVGLPSGPRLLGNGSAQLGYELYGDDARTTAWGPRGSGTVPENYRITLDRGPQSSPYGEVSIPIYGRLTGGQTVTATGLYTAVLTGAEVTVSTATQLPCGSINYVRDTFNVSARARVPGTCSINAQDLHFGSHSDLSANIDATSTIDIVCTQDLPYNVKLDGGQTGNVNARRMALQGAAASGSIGYRLYRDQARTQTWGNTDTTDFNGTGSGGTQALTVYGRVPAPQATPAAGSYRDTVTATVEY